MTLLAAALTLPVFVLEMGGHLFPAFHHWVHATIGLQTSRLIQFALTTAVLFGPGLSSTARASPRSCAVRPT
jgi:cation transport ATPase